MAVNNNLQDFLKNLADGLRLKKKSSDKIDAQNFYDELVELDFGIPIYAPSNPLTVQTNESYAPAPYDADGYNTNGDGGQPLSVSQTITIDTDLTDYNNVYVMWTNEGCMNGYGEIYATIDLYGSVEEIYRNGNSQTSVWGSGVTTYNGKIISEFDVSSVTGVHNFTVSVHAYSPSPYGGNHSKASITIHKIFARKYVENSNIL